MKPITNPGDFARAALFVLLPAVAVGGALGLPLLLCLAGTAALGPSLLRQVIENRSAALLALAAFLTWVIASSAWSPYPKHEQALKLAILAPLGLAFVAGCAASARAQRLARAGGLAAFIVLTGLLLIEATLSLPLNQAGQPDAPLDELIQNVSRGVVVLMALGWGAAASLISLPNRTGLLAAFVVLIFTAGMALQFDRLAHVIAFALGSAAFIAAFTAPRFSIFAVTGGLAGWLLASPFVTPLVLANQRLVDALPLSWAARGGIWTYVCDRIAEQPWIGHGLDVSRAVTDRIQVRDLNIRAVPLHPHSASLQIWFESGAVGAILAAAALLLGGRALARAFGDNRPAAAAVCATFASLGLIANVSFGAWQEWWDATLFVAAAMICAIPRTTAPVS